MNYDNYKTATPPQFKRVEIERQKTCESCGRSFNESEMIHSIKNIRNEELGCVFTVSVYYCKNC